MAGSYGKSTRSLETEVERPNAIFDLLELDSLMSCLVLASQFMSMFDDWLWPWTRAEPTKDPGPTEGPPGTDKILCFGIWVGQVVRCIQRRRRDRSRGGRHEMNHKNHKRTESR